jgi:hypothetical protein
MKYLKLYESFESTTLSKVINYVRSKVDKKSGCNRFVNRLKKLQQELDIPISKIQDKDVKYLNRIQALKFRNTEYVSNTTGIYCLKFWFSLNDGFIGFTSTGNQVYKFGESERDVLDERDIDYIKNELNIKTGELSKVVNYNDIRHGQMVIGIFSSNYYNLDRLALAKIWRDGNRIWAIQNVSDGGTPGGEVNGEHWLEWGNQDERFIKSWSLSEVQSPGDDHHKLYFYTPSDKPLKVIGFEEPTDKEKVENPLNYNLPLNSSFKVCNWYNTDWSIDGKDDLEKADFSVVIILDDILKSEFKPVTLTQKERQESRKGATKLMSDETIRNTNIERYLDKIIKNMISIDTSEIKNLQKIVLNNLAGDFAYISIWKDRPSLDFLGEMSNLLYSAVISDNKEDKEYYLRKSIDVYRRQLKSNNDCIKFYTRSFNIVKNQFDNEQIKEFFDIIMRMGKKIKEFVANQKIETIEDIRMFQVKFNSIRMISKEREFYLNTYIRSVIAEFNDDADVEYYFREYKNRDLSMDIKRIKHVERYVNSILR